MSAEPIYFRGAPVFPDTYVPGNYVPPSGHPDAPFVVCGEAPASEEVRLGKGFVGPSGKLLWPVMRRLARVDRADCWVTNLSKTPLDNDESSEIKLTPEEFEVCREALHRELALLTNPADKQILAVGVWAARALLPNFTRMEVHNGMTYTTPEGWKVTPCFHPAGALRGVGEGKDPLAWMGDALAHWGANELRVPKELDAVPPYVTGLWAPLPGVLAVDTEGTPDDPICLTWSDGVNRGLVMPEDVPAWWRMVQDKSHCRLVFHNAPWDWAVLEAMGVKEPYTVPFVDTMELAYLHQTEPQGLKDLSLRHYGLEMKGWEDVVMPYYDEVIVAMAQGRVEAGTTVITHSEKTGKLLKKPKVVVAEEVKPLKRALENPKLLRARVGEFPEPSLRHVPFHVMAEYATLDPWMTRKVWEVLR